MVPLAPPLTAALEIRLSMENGHSVSQSVKNYIQSRPHDEFARELAAWLFSQQSGGEFQKPIGFYRKALIEILQRGLKGDPILERLKEFESETLEVSKEELDKHLERLPYICMIPLMLFQFPAFLLLLLGPIVLELLEALSQ